MGQKSNLGGHQSTATLNNDARSKSKSKSKSKSESITAAAAALTAATSIRLANDTDTLGHVNYPHAEEVVIALGLIPIVPNTLEASGFD